MTDDEKRRLARTGDMGIEAAAFRLWAAREAAGLSQVGLGEAAGVGKTAVSNAERGRSFPSRSMMVALYSGHGIDFNFLVAGDYSRLPADVQDRLFFWLSRVPTRAAPAED